MPTDLPVISVVVPCYNEAEVLELFYNRTVSVLKGCAPDYEIIFVNDGSRDQTAKIILTLHEVDARVKLVNLSRNFGKEIAMTACIDFAAGAALYYRCRLAESAGTYSGDDQPMAPRQ